MLDFSPDGSLLAVAYRTDQTFSVWDLSSGVEVECRDRPVNHTTIGIAFSLDGRYLATIGSQNKVNRIIAWKKSGAAFERHPEEFVATESLTWAFTFAGGNTELFVVTSTGDRENSRVALQRFDVASGKELPTIQADLGRVWYGPILEASRDGRWIAIASLGQLQVYAAPNWSQVGRIIPIVVEGIPSEATSLAISGEGRWAAISSYDRVELLEVATGRSLLERRLQSSIATLDFSIGDRTLYAGLQEGRIERIDLASLPR